MPIEPARGVEPTCSYASSGSTSGLMSAPAVAPARRRRPSKDAFGYDPAFHASVRPIGEFLYRRYWRVQTDGLENIPAAGAALIVSNHSGGIPFDASMIGTAIDLDHPRHRLVRF